MSSSEIEVFIRKKKDQCEKLIQFGIWHGVDSNNLGAWLKNFSSLEEKYFACCLLDWLVYRNDEHVVSMLYDLLTKHLHNQWRQDGNPLYSEEMNPLVMAREKWKDPGFRYVTAVTKKDKDTKSGYHIARYLNQKLEVSTNWNIKNSEMDEAYQKGVRTFLFVDDIIGTGEQMRGVIRESGLSDYKDVYVYVMVCAAHQMGIKEIKEEFPYVKVLYAEYVPSDDCVFDQLPFSDIGIESADEFKKWYVDFMESRGVQESSCLGRGDLGLAYAFESGIPNDSLPILYYHNEKLNRLLVKRGS